MCDASTQPSHVPSSLLTGLHLCPASPLSQFLQSPGPLRLPGGPTKSGPLVSSLAVTELSRENTVERGAMPLGREGCVSERGKPGVFPSSAVGRLGAGKRLRRAVCSGCVVVLAGTATPAAATAGSPDGPRMPQVPGRPRAALAAPTRYWSSGPPPARGAARASQS